MTARVRVVIDTNVLLSAMLKAGSVPDQLLARLWERGDVAVYDARICLEYREIVTRKKFAKSLDPERVAHLLDTLLARGEELRDVARWDGALRDESDRIFVEAALAGDASAIVTGNLRDYPTDLGIAILPPATQLAQLA